MPASGSKNQYSRAGGRGAPPSPWAGPKHGRCPSRCPAAHARHHQARKPYTWQRKHLPEPLHSSPKIMCKAQAEHPSSIGRKQPEVNPPHVRGGWDSGWEGQLSLRAALSLKAAPPSSRVAQPTSTPPFLCSQGLTYPSPLPRHSSQSSSSRKPSLMTGHTRGLLGEPTVLVPFFQL